MSNIEAARQNARNGAELGDLRRRYNDAAIEGRFKAYRAEVEQLSAKYKAALLAGDGDAAEAARRAGVAAINKYYNVED